MKTLLLLAACGAMAAVTLGLSAAEAGAPESKPRRLIVNADDFGLTDGVTAGIIAAWRDGIVTSTSAMINIAGAPARIKGAHTLHPELPIGLHLNITEGRPVLPAGQVPTLVRKDGSFYPIGEILAHLSEISLTELRAELNAQAEAFLACGFHFDHLDYHHHILALYTRFYPVVREMAKTYGVPVRQPVPVALSYKFRFSDGAAENGTGQGGGSNAAFNQLLPFILRHPLKAMGMMRYVSPAAFKRQAKLLQKEGIPAPDWFVEGFYGNASEARLIAIIQQLPPGTSELMVHPAADGGYEEDRAAELRVLTSGMVKDALAAAGVELTDFSGLTGPNAG